MRLRQLPALLFGLIGLGCLPTVTGAQCTGPPDPTGAWEWIQSVGGIAGETRTPETVGVTWQLQFMPDGTLLSFRDEEIERSASYVIACQEWEVDVWDWTLRSEAYPLEDISPAVDIVPLEVGRELHLIDPCCDLFHSTFASRDLVVPVPTESTSWGRIKTLFR